MRGFESESILVIISCGLIEIEKGRNGLQDTLPANWLMPSVMVIGLTNF